MLASAGIAQADDRATLTITTTTTTTNNVAIFAQMESIGTDFVRRYGLAGGTDASSSASDIARSYGQNNRSGFANAIANASGLVAADVTMRRTLEKIEREQKSR